MSHYDVMFLLRTIPPGFGNCIESIVEFLVKNQSQFCSSFQAYCTLPLLLMETQLPGALNVTAVDCQNYNNNNNNYSTPAQIGNFTVSCPPPLIPLSDHSSLVLPSCYVPCYPPLFAQDVYKSAKLLFLICCAMSVVCTAFLALTWMVFEQRRKQVYVASFIWSSLALSLCQLASTVRRNGDVFAVGCVDANTFMQPSADNVSNECLTQGWLIHVLALVATHWWFCIAFDLWLDLCGWKRKRTPMERKALGAFYHIWCWAVPVALTAPSLASRDYGWDVVMYCFVFSPANRLALFIYPMAAHIVVAMAVTTHSVVIVCSTTKNIRTKRSTVRIMMFVFVMLLVFAMLATFMVTSTLYQDEYQASLVDMLTCYYSPEYDVYGAGSCLQVPDFRSNPFILYATIVLTSAQGVFVFSVFGTQLSVWTQWRDVFFTRVHVIESSQRQQIDTNRLSTSSTNTNRTRTSTQ